MPRNIPRAPRRPIAALIGALCTGAALADGEHSERTDVIEVIGHYQNAIGTSDAASQGYITPKLIESRPIQRPADVLEAVPGLVVTQHSGDGKANQYYLRGFNLDHGTDFATSVAGAPVNMPSHGHGQGYSDLNFLIPELVSRIDYRKGPYYASEGNFSSAGAAHFHYQDKLKENILEASAGGFGFRRLLGAASRDAGSGKLLYAMELVGNNGPWVNANDYTKINGVLRYSLANGASEHRITGMHYSGEWNATDQIPLRAINSGLVPRLGSLDKSDGGNTSRTSLGYEFRHDHGDRQFQLNAYGIRYRMRLYSNFTYFMRDPVNGDQFEQLDQRSVHGISPTWLWTGRVAGRESITKAGLQYRRDDIGKVGLYNTAARQRVSTVREDSVGETALGVFAENSFAWTDWFRSIVGARADTYSFNVNSNNPLNSGKTNDNLVSPKLGLVFGPWAETEFFVNAGNGFHSNDARGTVIRVDPSTLAPAQQVPALARTRGSEIGARTEIIPTVQSSIAVWKLSLASELLFVGDAGTTQASRPSERNGVEWSNRWKPNRWLLLDFDLSLSRARFSDNDPAGPNIPGSIGRVVSLGASVDDYGPWSGSVHLRQFGPRPLLADNSQRSDSATLVNARLSYRMEKNVRLTLDVINLFDRRANDIEYFYQSQLRGEAGSVGDKHLHPVEPRSLRLAVRTTF